MDVDDNIPKSSKGIQSFTSLNGEVILSRVVKDIIIIFECGFTFSNKKEIWMWEIQGTGIECLVFPIINELTSQGFCIDPLVKSVYMCHFIVNYLSLMALVCATLLSLAHLVSSCLFLSISNKVVSQEVFIMWIFLQIFRFGSSFLVLWWLGETIMDIIIVSLMYSNKTSISHCS